MLEVALTVVSVASTLSAVGVTYLFSRMQAKLLDHLKATAQIGGTPVELATKQTEMEMLRMQRINESAAQQEKLIEDLKAMKNGEAQFDRGPLS